MGVALVGGSDPAEIARRCPVRVAHTQIKDVDAAWDVRVRVVKGLAL